MAIPTIQIQLGYKANVAVFFSIATTLLILSIYWTESNESKTSLKLLIPFSSECRLSKNIIQSVLLNGSTYAEAQKEIRSIMILRALKSANGNQSEVARTLGIDRKTVRKEIEKSDEY